MNAHRTFHDAHKSAKRALHLHVFFVTCESKIIALLLAFFNCVAVTPFWVVILPFPFTAFLWLLVHAIRDYHCQITQLTLPPLY